MKSFFFDTADLNYIKTVWADLSENYGMNPSSIFGITTNPKAFTKIDHKNSTLTDTIKELADWYAGVRQYSKGIIYVQLPDSSMGFEDTIKFINKIKACGNGFIDIGLKIPPFHFPHATLEFLSTTISLNITGVADAALALRSLSYPVDFVSILTGRMEEVGIDAREQVKFIRTAINNPSLIAGSMRTLDQLAWVIEEGMLPTIGTSIWDQGLRDPEVMERIVLLLSAYTPAALQAPGSIRPGIPEQGLALTKSFIEEMDACSKLTGWK